MTISMQGIFLVAVAAILMSFGSLGLRASIDAIGGFGSDVSTIYKDIFALILNPIFLLGLALYGSGTLIWMRVLATEPLSIGYPILMSIAFISITLGAALFFREAISPLRLIGMVVIVVGVVIATRG